MRHVQRGKDVSTGVQDMFTVGIRLVLCGVKTSSRRMRCVHWGDKKCKYVKGLRCVHQNGRHIHQEGDMDNVEGGGRKHIHQAERRVSDDDIARNKKVYTRREKCTQGEETCTPGVGTCTPGASDVYNNGRHVHKCRKSTLEG